MANLKSSVKRIKTNNKAHISNVSKRSKIRTFIKKVHNSILTKDKTKAFMEFQKVQSILDKYSMQGLIHKNKAARHKKRLMSKINNIE